jgi:hypothetical protein
MSTEIADIHDALEPEFTIEIAVSSPYVRLFSTERKIWLNKEGVHNLLEDPV